MSSTSTQFKKGDTAWNKGLKGYMALEKNPKWKGGQVEITCKSCLSTFLVDQYRASKARTCSQACNRAYRKSPDFREKLSVAQRSRPEYQNNVDWKLLIRTCSKYSRWREQVFQRDDYTCKECGVRGGRLNADHIVPFINIVKAYGVRSLDEALFCEALWDVSNGRTLCVSCHMKTPTYGGKMHKLTKTN